MSYKLQTARNGRWEDINQKGFTDLSQRRAEELAEGYNTNPHRQYRAVPADCPQEPLTKEQEQDREVQEA